MLRLIRTGLAALAAVLGTIFFAVFCFLVLLQFGAVQGLVSEQVGALLGRALRRTVHLEGLALSPTGALRVEHVSIGSRPGFDPPFLEAWGLRGRLDLAELFRGRVLVDWALVNRVAVRILYDEAGHNNLPGRDRGSGGRRPDPRKDPFDGLFARLYMRQVTVDRGSLLVDHRPSGVVVRLETGLGLTGRAFQPGYDLVVGRVAAEVSIRDRYRLPVEIAGLRGTWTRAGIAAGGGVARVFDGDSRIRIRRFDVWNLRRGYLDGRYEVDVALADIQRAFETPPMTGRVRGYVTMEGPGPELRWGGELRADRLHTLGLTFRRVVTGLFMDRAGLRSEGLEAELAAGPVRGAVALVFSEPGRTPLRVELTLREGRARELARQWRLPYDVTGTTAARVALWGDARRSREMDGRFEVHVRAPVLAAGDEGGADAGAAPLVPVDLDVEADLRRGRLVFERCRLSSSALSGRVAGEMGLDGRRADLSLALRAGDIEPLRRLVDRGLRAGGYAPIPWGPLAGRASIAATVEGDLGGDLRVGFEGLVEDFRWADLGAEDLRIRGLVDTARRRLTLDDVRLSSLTGAPSRSSGLTARGTIELGRYVTLDAFLPRAFWPAGAHIRFPLMKMEVGLRLLDLERFWRLVEAPVPLAGLADGSLSFDVGRRRQAVTFDLVAARARLRDLPLDRVRLVGGADGGELDARLTALHGVERFDASWHSAPEGAFAAQLRSTPLSMTTLEGLTGGPLPVTGAVELEARLGGMAEAPQGEARLRASDLVLEKTGGSLARLGGATLNLALAGRRLSFEGRLFDRAHRVNGTVDLGEDDHIALHAAYRDLRLERLLALFGQHAYAARYGGQFDGVLDLEGPLARPEELRATATMSRLVLKTAQMAVRNVEPLRLHLDRGIFSVRDAVLVGPDTRLNVSGEVAATGSRRVDIRVEGEAGLQIARLFTTAITHAEGRIETAVRIAGERGRVRVDGRAQVAGGLIALTAFDQPIEKITGRIRFDGDRYRIESLEGQLGGGRIEAAGTVTFGAASTELDVTARLDRVRLALHAWDLETTLSGDLEVFGPFLRPDVRGALRTTGGRYRADINYRGILGSAVLQLVFGTRPAPVEGDEETFDPLFRNLVITSTTPLRVDNNIAQVGMDLDLTLVGPLSRPGVLGTMEMGEGWFIFEGRRFRLLSGTMHFNDPKEFNPVVDLLAQAEIDRVLLTVRLSGQSPRINLEIGSEPELSLADKLALITLGRRVETLATSSGVVTGIQAGAYLTGQLQEQLTQRIKAAWGFDRFVLDPIFATEGTSTGLRLTVGKQLSDSLYVTYSIDVAGAQSQSLLMEYRLSEHVSLVGERRVLESPGAATSTGGGTLEGDAVYGADVKFTIRFD